MLIPPALVLSIAIASLYALVFLLIWGQRTRKKPLYWLASVAGFGIGQVLAKISSTHPLMIGNLHLLAGTLVSWAALFVAKWFRL